MLCVTDLCDHLLRFDCAMLHVMFIVMSLAAATADDVLLSVDLPLCYDVC